MQTIRSQKYQRAFEKTHGEGSWEKFCERVWSDTRPQVIQAEFKSLSGGPMNKPSYYKWEARAHEVKGQK